MTGLGSKNGVSSYFPMTNPVNAAIYAFGGFMLFALAIGFFAAPLSWGAGPKPEPFGKSARELFWQLPIE